MKRDELKALGLTDEQIDKVMGINGNDINAAKQGVAEKDQQITSLTTERDGLKQQVADRDKDIGELKKTSGSNEELTKKLAELQTKYDTDTSALTQKLDKQARDHAAESLFSGMKFTSAFAKKAAIQEFLSANPEFKDGKYVNADEIVKKMKEQNADAFVVEGGGDPKPDPHKNDPKFTGGLNKPEGGGGEKNPFAFNFTAIRKTDAK